MVGQRCPLPYIVPFSFFRCELAPNLPVVACWLWDWLASLRGDTAQKRAKLQALNGGKLLPRCSHVSNKLQPKQEHDPRRDCGESLQAIGRGCVPHFFRLAQIPNAAIASATVASICIARIVKASSFMPHWTLGRGCAWQKDVNRVGLKPA